MYCLTRNACTVDPPAMGTIGETGSCGKTWLLHDSTHPDLSFDFTRPRATPRLQITRYSLCARIRLRD